MTVTGHILSVLTEARFRNRIICQSAESLYLDRFPAADPLGCESYGLARYALAIMFSLDIRS